MSHIVLKLKTKLIRGLLSVLAIVAGLMTSLLIQTLISGWSHAEPIDSWSDTDDSAAISTLSE